MEDARLGMKAMMNDHTNINENEFNFMKEVWDENTGETLP